ncbi:hypothetical protein C1752_00699 [Acaryochloris thomasi RCC1774]|uniref:Uncharacterized protein n=1 Tax=Acaryochloris thomasi RCC1774 TaxID=1764569 RepID=A0A2W1JMX1_9CYAN|nr:hypothetical protein [Acaryochloris thomasi]PZD74566.1 hypothetical protein C1752_00699 [Acaryochloris thomasi RCC1774]
MLKLISVSHRRISFPLVSTLAFVLSASTACSAQVPDVTERLETLGNPMANDGKTGRALNVWDLQRFGGKLYLAGGSTVSNAGPINVWAYSPAQQTFVKEFTVREEAIEQFKVFGKSLYIPAADPKSGDKNKFYRRTLKQPWQLYKFKTPALAHVRDLFKTKSGDILLVGNNRRVFKNPSRPAAAITRDQGASFQGAGLEQATQFAANWFFSVFPYRGKIYAPSSLLRDAYNQTGVIGVYNPKRRKIELSQTLRNDEFIPRTLLGPQVGAQGSEIIYRLWKPTAYKGYLAYPVRSYSYTQATYQSAYMNSIGFYVKENIGITPTAVVFPDGQSVGEDVLIQDDYLYALANTKVSAEEFWVYVYRTKNLADARSWQPVFRFKSRNKARSFEYLENAFYFGLGQDHNDLVADSGAILRVSLPTAAKDD